MATNIGTGPQDIPLNQYLGDLAFQDTHATSFFRVLASDPATGVVGECYFNSTDSKVKVYDGTAWADLASGGGSSSGTVLSSRELSTLGSPIGDMTQDGGLASAFNGVTTGNFTTGARKDPSTGCSIGRNFGQSVELTDITIYRPDGDGTSGSNCFPGSGGGTNNITFQKSNDGSSWTTVATANGTTNKSLTVTFQATSAQYWRVAFTGDSNGGTVQEMIFQNHNAAYTTRGLIFDWDPGNVVGFSDGGGIANGSDLRTGLRHAETELSTNNFDLRVNGGSFVYRTGDGGYIDSTTSQGRISMDGAAVENALDAATSLTLTCWFQSDGSSRQVLISRFGTGFNDQFNHIVDPTGDFHSNSTGVIANTAQNHNFNAWSNNTWHLCHFVYNVSDGIARWYIDGSQVGTSNWGTDGGNGLSGAGTSGFGIMSRADRLEDLVGFMGPVRIHDVALTPTEVTADWNAQKARYGY